MRVLAVLVLVLGISYVKADGGHHPPPVEHDAYGPPEPSYGAPAYEEPPSYHPEPVYHEATYEPERRFDITVFIVACLVLIGLSLLFPDHVWINTVNPVAPNMGMNTIIPGRKKRYAEEIIERSDFAGRTMEIYDHLNMALEPVDRGCMEKITCEVGALSYDAGLTSHPFLKLVVPFVPGKYGKYVKSFLYVENCHKIKCSVY